MKTLPALITTLLLLATVFVAAQEYGPPYSYNHPTNCLACHSNSTSTATNALSSLTGGVSSNCNPSQGECVWNHQVLTGTIVWKMCQNCHSAIWNSINGGAGKVHQNLLQNYGCACHAVAHVGYGNPTDGYTACIYFYVPVLSTAGQGYFGAKPKSYLDFQNVYICFYGKPEGQYTFSGNAPQSLIELLNSAGEIKVKALNVSYTKSGNEIIAVSSQAKFFEADFFTALEKGGIFRYENATANGAVLKNPVSTHALTETAPEGETIIMGVLDIHTGDFILVAPYAPYSRYPYYAPVGINPPVAACFNCHFVYQGQLGTAKVMEVGGVWKIGIPADVLNSLTDPHKIVMPAAQAAGGVAPNLSLVALLATATLLGGAFLALRRRAQ